MRQQNLNEKRRDWQQIARKWLLANAEWHVDTAGMEPIRLRVHPPLQRRRTRQKPLDQE